MKNMEDKLTEKQYRRMMKYVPDYGCIETLGELPEGGVFLSTIHREGSGNDPEDWCTVTTEYKFSGPSMRACRIYSVNGIREEDQ
tara:strand:- start:1129 stop:1383 length:255 start_codon:yes stop_codon:yes gene_type:complete